MVEEFIILEGVRYSKSEVGTEAAIIAVETVNQFLTLFKPALEVVYQSPFEIKKDYFLKDNWSQFTEDAKKMGWENKYHYNLEFDDSGLVKSWGLANEDLKGKMPSKFKAFPGPRDWDSLQIRKVLTSLMEEKRDYLVLNFKDRRDYQMWGNIHIVNEDSRAFYEAYDQFVAVNIAGFSTNESPLYLSYGRDAFGFAAMIAHIGREYNILVFPLSPVKKSFMNWDSSPV